MTRMLRQIGLIALILFASMGSLFAQDAEPARKSPLGVRQDNVTRMIEEMEEKFVRLAKALGGQRAGSGGPPAGRPAGKQRGVDSPESGGKSAANWMPAISKPPGTARRR
jgi:hypothetical protein